MLRELAISRMFSATETFIGSAFGSIFFTSPLTLSSLVSVMCSILPTIPWGSRSTGIIVTYSRNSSIFTAGSALVFPVPTK